MFPSFVLILQVAQSWETLVKEKTVQLIPAVSNPERGPVETDRLTVNNHLFFFFAFTT